MFEKGSLLIYDTTGVCRVEDISFPSDLPVSDKTKEYYKLAPLFGSGMIYIPVDTRVSMRPVISREEAELLIRKIPEISETAYDTTNQKALEERCKALLNTQECEDLIRLIKTVYIKKQNLARKGKKVSRTEEQYMKRAQALLHEELSVTLEIPKEEVEGYIARTVEEKEEENLLSR